MNAFAIVLFAILAVTNAGVIHQTVPVGHHDVSVLHTLHATPVITRVVPAAQSSSFSYRAPAAQLAVPVIAHHPVAVHAVHAVHTPVIAHQVHQVTPLVMHHVLLH